MIDDLRNHLHYDEELAVEFYVLRHYRHLLTDVERATLDEGLAHWWDDSREQMHEWGAHARAASVAPPWEPLPLDPRHVAFARSVVARLRAEHGDAIAIARCVACTRVLRSPEALACPWCGRPVPR